MKVNNKLKGLVIRLADDRIDLLLSISRDNENSPEFQKEFAEPTEDFSYSRNLPLTCFLLGYDGHLIAIALARRGVSAGTALRRVNLSDVVYLNRPVPSQLISENISNRLSKKVNEVFDYEGLFTSKGFFAVVESLSELAPELQDTFERFSIHKYKRIAKLSDNERGSLARQKEALNTALMIGGFDRTGIQRWQPPKKTEKATSFLDGLPQCRLREDPMVINDLNNFPGMKLLETTPFPSAVFEGKNKRLTVLLANRLPLEQQTGTDLIYYNETYKSFVMIQYKALEKNGDEAIFRFPNKQLSEEIDRMDCVLDALKKIGTDKSSDNFRINNNPFFLKFCAREVLNPDDCGLIPGMYLPLEFWKKLESSDTLKGPRGGKYISYKNVGRYMDNTEFSHLVSKAWIGTSIEQSQQLEMIIKDIIKNGKSAMLAIKTDKQHGSENEN